VNGSSLKLRRREPVVRPRPTPGDLLAARNRTIPDVLQPYLQVLFCGINPSVYSAWMQHHFARPGNRFWPALFKSGFTARLLYPWEDYELIAFGCGITNIVDRATNAAAELTPEELKAGARELTKKLRRFQPQVVAFLGISAYRVAWEKPEARLGPQPEMIGFSRFWVLPNPSGLNAHFPPPKLAEHFGRLRTELKAMQSLRTQGS
jgi:double-stranded uracil-DNA glycosylase